MARKKILFIAQHRPHRSPSQRFRFEQYLNHLNANGYDHDFSYLIEEEDDKVLYAKGRLLSKAQIFLKSYRKRLADIGKANSYDIIFVQREAFMTGTTKFERAFASSKAKLVFDFDDSIWLTNVSDANKYLNFLKKPGKTAKIIGLADHVIAGNTYLADYARQYNREVTIIPTTIDTIVFRPVQRKSSDRVTIGWSGSITTIQHFNHALPVLRKIKAHYGDRVSIEVIGDANFVVPELSIQGIAWRAESETEDLGRFDIGIMPLPNDEWTKGKCGLKGLSYMALEIPTVMSPVGVNTEIIKDGENGFLADTEEDWYQKLVLLIEDATLRKRLGEAGRVTVESAYSVKANADRYLAVFNGLLKAT